MKVLITGGAGFVGTNVADHLLTNGHQVIVLDNLSRAGVPHNWAWLRRKHRDQVELRRADIRDAAAVRDAVRQADQIFHFAAQVAVTTSLINPLEDFEINIKGTLNVLEAMRMLDKPPSLVFTSTNKVYGALDEPMEEGRTRYHPLDKMTARYGFSESRPLDFHSPYGCSKGAADQYVLDYSRSYGLPTVVFRMSCIYGEHQFGTEDQGWVAHFLISALREEPVTLYGDGKQVRDVLFVDDLVKAMLLAQANMDTLAGQAFNIGGGVSNTISLIELLDLIGDLTRRPPLIRFDDWRVGDQRYYVSDTRKFELETGWKAKTNVRTGVERLYHWLLSERILWEKMTV